MAVAASGRLPMKTYFPCPLPLGPETKQSKTDAVLASSQHFLFLVILICEPATRPVSIFKEMKFINLISL